MLTWVTVAATFFDLGNVNIMIALGIAVVKSSLVVLYFMHLRYDNPFNGIIFIASILFVMLFIGFLLIDTKEYAPEIIPGYAPEIQQAATAASSDTVAPAVQTPAAPHGATPGEPAAAAPAHGTAPAPAQGGTPAADSAHAATDSAAPPPAKSH